jgi:hypothetical protein
LRQWVAKQLSPIAKPDDIRFTDALPKTRSGKIMRRLLRSLARGEEISDDVSTLENPAIIAQLRGEEPPRTRTAAGRPAVRRSAVANKAVVRRAAANRPAASKRKIVKKKKTVKRKAATAHKRTARKKSVTRKRGARRPGR